MVIVRISGGLGNQMFQYAAGKACAIRNGCELKVELSAYERPPQGQEAPRKFELPVFIEQIPVVTPSELETINRFNHSKIYKAYNRSRKLLSLAPAYTYCQERLPMHFDPTILKSRGGVIYADGDWQNEKYFVNIADVLRELFRPKNITADTYNSALSQEMAIGTSISLHVRRGDYLNNEIHKPCSLGYYQAAIDTIGNRLQAPRFYIFSDDMDWARENLRFGEFPCLFLDYNTGTESYKDLFLMSCCQHHIIANSSFSWWGAWLNFNENKVVIAPDEWLPALAVKAIDVVPESWIIL